VWGLSTQENAKTAIKIAMATSKIVKSTYRFIKVFSALKFSAKEASGDAIKNRVLTC